MRVLVLSPFLPWPPVDGGRIRIHQLVRGLAHDHEVSLLAMTTDSQDVIDDAARAFRDDGVETELLPITGGLTRAALRSVAKGTSLYEARYFDRRFAERVVAAFSTRDPPDAVQAEFSYMGQYRRYLPGSLRARWVLDEHNVEFRISDRLAHRATRSGGSHLYRAYAARERRLRRRDELSACRLADAVLTVSSADGAALQTLVPELKWHVVPNGVHLDPEPYQRADGNPPSLIYLAKMDYRSNIDAVMWFCAEILPLVRQEHPSVTFKIVGANPPLVVQRLARGPGVEVLGFVEDARAHLRAATLSVVPLRAGSGTRLKILESLAVGRAVVSTAIGCEGLDLDPGRHLEVADSPAAFAASVNTLLADRQKRESLALAGRAAAEARYSWETAISALRGVYAALSALP